MSRNKNLRVLFAGHEIGGQMGLFAETMRSKGVNAVSAAFNEDFRHYQNDFTIPKKTIPWKRFIFAVKAIINYDVFHFFWGVSLFDFWVFHGLDLPILKILNKKIVVHFRGTDIVNLKYYHFLSQGYPVLNHQKPPLRSRPDQQEKIKRWKKYADQILVSTPDLIDLVDANVKLVPQVINCKVWMKPLRQIKGEIIRIAHAPTRRVAKGTDILIEAVEKLKEKGYSIQLDLVEGESPAIVKEVFEKCDIGVDQLLNGWYGKVAVELMALGKPVVCYINPLYRSTRPDLPIVNAGAQNLTTVLEELVLNHTLRDTIGKKSIDYVLKYHDADQVTDDLLDMYKQLKT